MSVGPLGMLGSVAGTPLSQTKGSEPERAADDTGQQAREAKANENAEKAAGIGQTEQDEQASERDADGRRLWEQNTRDDGPDDAQDGAQPETTSAAPPLKSKDATGLTGNHLDLTG